MKSAEELWSKFQDRAGSDHDAFVYLICQAQREGAEAMREAAELLRQSVVDMNFNDDISAIDAYREKIRSLSVDAVLKGQKP